MHPDEAGQRRAAINRFPTLERHDNSTQQHERLKLARIGLFRNSGILAALLIGTHRMEEPMAVAKKTKTARGRKQDRARVAGKQEYEVRYESKKTGKSATAVKKAVKKVGNVRGKVEKKLARRK
jgi:hypothetical protein